MNKISNIKAYIGKNIRYFLAASAILAIFFISRSFPVQVITSESCKGGNCQAVLESPELSEKNPSFYVNDLLKNGSRKYYRLTFLARSNKNTKISVNITNPSDEDKKIKDLELEKSPVNQPQEIIFTYEPKYSDILFKKENANDGADINLSRIQISSLDIRDDRELPGLRPTIRGGVKTDNPDQQQKDNGFVFSQLKNPDTILGQIFKPKSEYISSVVLDMDIVKQDNIGGKKYKFELREAEYDGGVPEITSNILASVDFTAENIERFRQDDGRIKFPIFAKLDQEKYYFIGINNNNVAVDKFNFLRLKGTDNPRKYSDGTVAIKTKGKTYSVAGNLYFITNELNFAWYRDKKILNGGVIEDVGSGHGKFTYMPDDNLYALADLEKYTSDIGYDEDDKVVYGQMKTGENSEMIYKFDTIFPFRKISISGEQADPSWAKASVLFSYDDIEWTEIPVIQNNSEILSSEKFNYAVTSPDSPNKLYVKIVPKEFENGEKYGIKNFKVETDLTIK